MSTQDILAELPRLSVEEREQIAKALRDLERKERTNTAQEPRVANLHPGAMIMAPDFDDPLPDEFWFGKES